VNPGTPAGRPDARYPGLPSVRRQVGAEGVLASVVATVNLTAGTGAISFVYPVTGVPASGTNPDSAVVIEVVAETMDRTGVEMEALTAATVGLLTIYDMCKAVDRGMRIDNVRLLEKSGGKSGHYKGA